MSHQKITLHIIFIATSWAVYCGISKSVSVIESLFKTKGQNNDQTAVQVLSVILSKNLKVVHVWIQKSWFHSNKYEETVTGKYFRQLLLPNSIYVCVVDSLNVSLIKTALVQYNSICVCVVHTLAVLLWQNCENYFLCLREIRLFEKVSKFTSWYVSIYVLLKSFTVTV